MAYFFGIDIGSSFLKGAVIDVERRRLGHTERLPFPEFLPGPPFYREVDAAVVAARVEELLDRLATHAPACAGVVFTGQMHGFVLVDSRGEAVSPYISWLDRRVSDECFGRIAASLTDEELAETGREMRPGIAATVLYWLRENGALPPGRSTPVSLADFVVGRLCGAPPAMEPTQAAAFGTLRLADQCWHGAVLRKLGLDALCWPEVKPTGSPAGQWRGVPCYAPVGDQQCTLAGALLGDGELSVNIGTGSQVAMIVPTAASAGCQTRPYFDGRYLRTITHIPGGRALSALLGLLTELGEVSETEAWRRVEAAVASVPSTTVHASIAFYPGPCGSAGYLQNLREDNLSVGHVFRAAFESMARNYADCARRLDPFREAGRVVFSGGVARRSALVRERTAAALELPHRLSPDPEDALFGLMVLALAFSRGVSVREATGQL